MPVFASTIGQIFAPIFKAMSYLLAFFYALVPNYVFAIALLTITVMILSFPLNRMSTRAMFKMQLFQPEILKIKNKYKVTRDMSAAERQEMRQKLNEETMALYRENNVSMTGGCLPNLVIFPIFIVLYDVIRGLTNTCKAAIGSTTCASSTVAAHLKNYHVIWAPRYVIPNTALYNNLHAANGKMIAFGINLADSVRTPQAAWVDVLPFAAIVLIAVALQYIQIRQMTGRNMSTGAGQQQGMQQMQAMQKFMPLVMALIYINIPAAVVIYFIVSSLFRIGQQEWMYRRDPQIVAAMEVLKARRASGGSKSLGAAGMKALGPGGQKGTGGKGTGGAGKGSAGGQKSGTPGSKGGAGASGKQGTPAKSSGTSGKSTASGQKQQGNASKQQASAGKSAGNGAVAGNGSTDAEKPAGQKPSGQKPAARKSSAQRPAGQKPAAGPPPVEEEAPAPPRGFLGKLTAAFTPPPATGSGSGSSARPKSNGQKSANGASGSSTSADDQQDPTSSSSQSKRPRKPR